MTQTYNIHTDPDIRDEFVVMDRGRLVKARLPDRPFPNVSWYWIHTDNCCDCRHYKPPTGGRQPECLDPNISAEDFQNEYLYTNTCPEFEAGIHKSALKDNVRAQMELDVMRAVGIVEGEPSQQVDVIRDEPWSVDLALRAHREQAQFLNMAHIADLVERGEAENDPSTAWSGNYTDLTDDLERPEAPPDDPLEGEPEPPDPSSGGGTLSVDEGGREHKGKGEGGGQFVPGGGVEPEVKPGLLRRVMSFLFGGPRPDTTTVERALARLKKGEDYTAHRLAKVSMDDLVPGEGLQGKTSNLPTLADIYHKEGHKVAPVAVLKVRDKYVIVDGHHRYAASNMAGSKEMWVVVLEGNKYQATYERQFTPDVMDKYRSDAQKVMSARLSLENGSVLSTDATGHEHRGKGEGGGQFVGKASKPKRATPGSQLPQEVRDRLREYGMVGSFPPAEPVAEGPFKGQSSVVEDTLKITEGTKEELQFKALMSWDQRTGSGRISRQYRYTQEFADRNAAEKHDRVAAIEPHINKIRGGLAERMGDATLSLRKREGAAIANIIAETGLRPTDGEESVEHGHYGIGSLLAKHVKIEDGAAHLDFIGKEGIRNQTTVNDPANVAFLRTALANKEGETLVFKEATSDDAGKVLKELSVTSGGPEDIKVKDLRTLKAHQVAREAVANFPGPPPPLTGTKSKDVKLVKSAILAMATEVSRVLNNQPTESRDTYVHPEIWRQWQSSLQAAS